MAKTWSREDIQNVLLTIYKKAATDKKFRARVLKDPQKVIEEVSKKKIPEGLKFDVIENKPGVIQTFVLPNLVSDTLSNAELAAVAGGRRRKGQIHTNVQVNAEAVVNAVVAGDAAAVAEVAATTVVVTI